MGKLSRHCQYVHSLSSGYQRALEKEKKPQEEETEESDNSEGKNEYKTFPS